MNLAKGRVQRHRGARNFGERRKRIKYQERKGKCSLEDIDVWGIEMEGDRGQCMPSKISLSQSESSSSESGHLTSGQRESSSSAHEMGEEYICSGLARGVCGDAQLFCPSDSDNEHIDDWLNDPRIGDPIISPHHVPRECLMASSSTRSARLRFAAEMGGEASLAGY